MLMTWNTRMLTAAVAAMVCASLSARVPQPGQNQTPNPADVQVMMAALPEKAPATPKQPRKILVLGRAAGYVHSSIPLAARTVEEMGKKTRAWTTTITYDAADINEQNLKQDHVIFLASTTGAFLDYLNDEAATAARRKALLDFVRGGKGLAGIHAASDSYHRSTTASPGRGAGGPAAGGGGRGGDATPRPAPPLGPTGFPIQAPATQLGPDTQIGTWPDFNQMIGALFKWHWNDPQPIIVRLDEPSDPLNAPFKGQPFEILDETYTFADGVVVARQGACAHERRLREDGRRGQGQGACGDTAHRRRLRPVLDPSRGSGPAVLRGARSQRACLRDPTMAGASARGRAVRARRSAGG